MEDSLDREKFSRITNRVLRRRLLQTLFDLRAEPLRWISAPVLFSMCTDGLNPRFEDELHFRKLLRDLLIKGLVEERVRRPGRQQFTLDSLRYRISASGLGLILESLPPDLDILDDRVIIAAPEPNPQSLPQKQGV